MVLKGCRYVRASLYSLHVPSGFGGITGFEVNTSHVFSHGVLAAINLVGGGARDGGARARSWAEPGLPLYLVAITTLSGAVLVLKLQ